MTVFIELTVDAFDDNLDGFVSGSSRRGAGETLARRPLRGLEIKDDTFASLRVITASGKEIPLIDSGSRTGKDTVNTNFLLTSVREERVEKQQIVETFGEDYIFFFGERPRMLRCSAFLLNSLDFNWKAEFLANYEQFFRGTKLVELGARAYLFYDDNIVEGYMTNVTVMDDSMSLAQIQMAFDLFVMKTTNISFIGDPKYPTRPNYRYIPDSNLRTASRGNIPGGIPPWVGTESMTSPEGAMLAKQKADSKRTYINDNIDEWVGYVPPKPAQPSLADTLNDLANSVSKMVDNLCKAGAVVKNPSSIRDLGFMGPGGDLAGLKNAWDSAKRGDIGGIASGLGQAGILNVRGSSSMAVVTPFGTLGAGAGVSVNRNGAGAWASSYSGPGAAYYGGQGVGYVAGTYRNSSGAVGYYAGVGTYNQYGQATPAYGSGSNVSGTMAGTGTYSGWTPGAGWGDQALRGQVPMPPSFGTYNGTSGYGYGSAGVPAAAVQSGSYLGSYGYSQPGYATGGYSAGYNYPPNAQDRYYASAGASYDPQNGFRWGSSTDPTKPVPGQPGGGMFTTTTSSGTFGVPSDGTNASKAYGRSNPDSCKSAGAP